MTLANLGKDNSKRQASISCGSSKDKEGLLWEEVWLLHSGRGGLHDGQAEKVKVVWTGKPTSWTQDKTVFMTGRCILQVKEIGEEIHLRACVQRKQSLDRVVRACCGIRRRVARVVR